MSSPEIKQDRPPYVTFEKVAIENRDKSIEAGHLVCDDIDYAFITPMGSKDRIERRVDEWFAKLAVDVKDGRFPQEWLAMFRQNYKDWSDGQESPVNGTALEAWPVATPGQIKSLRSLHLRTVEDLATANEEVLMRLGMGGRALKQKAVDWMKAAEGPGKLSEEITKLRAANDALTSRNESLEARLVKLEAGQPPAAAKKL